MTDRVTAQGDQGETGDIGVKGDQVRHFNATFPSKFTTAKLHILKKVILVCFQGPPGVPGIKGEVIQNTLSHKRISHNQLNRGEMV